MKRLLSLIFLLVLTLGFSITANATEDTETETEDTTEEVVEVEEPTEEEIIEEVLGDEIDWMNEEEREAWIQARVEEGINMFLADLEPQTKSLITYLIVTIISVGVSIFILYLRYTFLKAKYHGKDTSVQDGFNIMSEYLAENGQDLKKLIEVFKNSKLILDDPDKLDEFE